MRPTTVMAIGSAVLMPIVYFTPRKDLLLVGIIFILIEIAIVVAIFIKESRSSKIEE